MTYSATKMVPAVGAGCGAALRQAREAAGLSIAQVASQLRMTVRSVANLESDDWSSLGAPVFVRGQLRSYARLLGIDIEPCSRKTPITAVAPSTLVSHSHTPAISILPNSIGRRAIYVAITAAILQSRYGLGTRQHLNGNEPRGSVARFTGGDAEADPTAPVDSLRRGARR